ncbi:MAG TPA: lactate utilization protein C [Kineosporiaceae bacterium]|nr:lactate utilization protein C [Kineosporiaceae bacterium]
MTAREEILGRIRTALADRPKPAPVERDYRTSGAPWTAGDETGSATTNNQDAVDTRLELLVDRLIDYRATVHRASPDTAADVIASALAERGAARIVVPDGFPAELLGGLDPAALVRDEPALTAAELDVIDGVLTTSTVTIAETGTIVLDAGPGQGRRALSLVPDYHLCVVWAADVVRGVPEAISRLDEASARPLTWISGPSATSDIELQRVEGVHGPRTLAVVLIA